MLDKVRAAATVVGMANEIKASLALSVAKNNGTLSANESMLATQVNNNFQEQVLIVTTTPTLIPVGVISNLGILQITNTGEDTVHADAVSGGAPSALCIAPGEFAFVPTRLTAWYVWSETINCPATVRLIER